jgi:hypothetical protein
MSDDGESDVEMELEDNVVEEADDGSEEDEDEEDEIQSVRSSKKFAGFVLYRGHRHIQVRPEDEDDEPFSPPPQSRQKTKLTQAPCLMPHPPLHQVRMIMCPFKPASRRAPSRRQSR